MKTKTSLQSGFRTLLWVLFYVLTLVMTGCALPESEKSVSGRTISIESTPRADIYLNGVWVGRTPDKNLAVHEGDLIELKAEGHQASSIEIGRVSSTSLQIIRAQGHKGINIRSDGLGLTLKKE